MLIAVVVAGLPIQLAHRRISLGTLLLVLAYLGFVYGPLCGIANTTGALQHEVVFENVTFEYEPGVRILDDVSFTAHPGDLVALVGPSGAGKTTAVQLIMRLYEATGGRILIDGVDVRQTL